MLRKSLVLLVTVISVLLIATTALAGVEKKTFCHAAGQADTLKFVTLTLPPAGFAAHFQNNGTPQAGHELDYLGACIVDATTTTTTKGTPSTTSTPSTTTAPTTTVPPVQSTTTLIPVDSTQPTITTTTETPTTITTLVTTTSKVPPSDPPKELPRTGAEDFWPLALTGMGLFIAGLAAVAGSRYRKFQ